MGASQEIIVYTHKMRTFLAITLMTSHAFPHQPHRQACCAPANGQEGGCVHPLTTQLNNGHKHDKSALATGIVEGGNAISSKKAAGKSKCQTFKDKACPTKREEMEADAAKANAKKLMQAVGKAKVCDSLGSTWGDMDVDKATPKYGDELRNKWDKKRGEYETAKAKYDAAVKKHDNAIKKHNAAMAEFKTALELEARNAVNACNQAHFGQVQQGVARGLWQAHL